MKYTITKARQDEDTLYTEVDYVFDDGSKVSVSIPHFQPQSDADVILGIENRGASEERKAAASKICGDIATSLPVGQTVG